MLRGGKARRGKVRFAHGGRCPHHLRQYRTNELVRRRMNFSSDAMADFEGLLEVNRKICKQQMAEKASPTLPTNCAVLPVETENGNTYNGLIKQSGACLS